MLLLTSYLVHEVLKRVIALIRARSFVVKDGSKLTKSPSMGKTGKWS
ncbi:hypothetical protein Hanom_Chr07g00658571 [Helianthus anomalus]